MKKLCLFLFFLVPNIVKADSLTLNNLEILNGTLSPEFQSLNNYYTVILNNDTYSIDFKYEEKDLNIKIINNYDLKNNSLVTLEVESENKIGIYNFHILKEEESVLNVFKEEENVPKNMMYAYKIFIIPSISFFLIIITFKIIFRSHKK